MKKTIVYLSVVLLTLSACNQPKQKGFGSPGSGWTKPARKANPEAEPPILPETFYAAGRLFEEQGEWAKAAIQYRKAVAVNHNYAVAYDRLGVVMGRLSRHREAVEALQRAVSLQPTWPALRNNLGYAYALLGMWHEAASELQAAVELQPDFARAQVNLGMVLARQQRFEEALNQFRAALPESDAYYNMGLMFRGQHRYQDAAEAFRHVLSIHPNFTAAQKQLDELAPKLALTTPLEPQLETPLAAGEGSGFREEGSGLSPRRLFDGVQGSGEEMQESIEATPTEAEIVVVNPDDLPLLNTTVPESDVALPPMDEDAASDESETAIASANFEEMEGYSEDMTAEPVGEDEYEVSENVSDEFPIDESEDSLPVMFSVVATDDVFGFGSDWEEIEFADDGSDPCFEDDDEASFAYSDPTGGESGADEWWQSPWSTVELETSANASESFDSVSTDDDLYDECDDPFKSDEGCEALEAAVDDLVRWNEEEWLHLPHPGWLDRHAMAAVNEP